MPAASAPVTVLVTGATTGAGASTVAANLADALGGLGSRVAVVDLSPYGTDALGPREWATLSDDVDGWRRDVDFVLLDAARVASALALDAAGLADRVLLVLDAGTAPATMADAIRELFEAWSDADVAVVVNRAPAPDVAEAAFVRLALARPAEATGPIEWLGHIVCDAAVARAVDARRVLVSYLPHAPAARCLRVLAARLLGLGPLEGPRSACASSTSGDAARGDARDLARSGLAPVADRPRVLRVDEVFRCA